MYETINKIISLCVCVGRKSISFILSRVSLDME